MAKFPFWGMDHGHRPWSSKNSLDRNRLKKFMQVEINVECIYTNFGGCGFSGFGDIATFQNGQISLSDHGLLRRIMLAEGRHFGRGSGHLNPT